MAGWEQLQQAPSQIPWLSPRYPPHLRTLLSLGTPRPGATTLVTPQWSQWPRWPRRPLWPAQTSAAPPPPASVPDVPAHWGPPGEDVLTGGSPSSWFAGGMHGVPFLWDTGVGSPRPEGDWGKRVLRGDGWAGGSIVATPMGWGDRRLPWWGGICPCVSRSERCQWEHGLGSRHGVTQSTALGGFCWQELVVPGCFTVLGRFHPAGTEGSQGGTSNELAAVPVWDGVELLETGLKAGESREGEQWGSPQGNPG